MSTIINGKTLAQLGLDWQVGLQSLWLTGDKFGQRISEARSVIRQDNGHELGVVGKRYTPVQNHELAALGNRIVNTTEAKWETGGQFNGGKLVYLSLKLPYTVHTSNDDTTDTYLVLANPHDGTGSTHVNISTVRPICKNSLKLAWKKSLESVFHKVSLRHTQSITGRLIDLQAELGDVMKACEDYEEKSKVMLKYTYSPADLDRFLKEMGFASENTLKETTSFERQRDEFLASLNRAPGQSGIQKTAWGLLQGATFYADHVKQYRKGTDKEESISFGAQADWKTKALNVAFEMAK